VEGREKGEEMEGEVRRGNVEFHHLVWINLTTILKTRGVNVYIKWFSK